MIRSCSYLRNRRSVFAAGLVLAAMAAAPMPMWAQQWNGTDPVWTSAKVGIGTMYPIYRMDVFSTADAPTARFTSTSLTYGPQFSLDATQAGGTEFRLVSTPQNGSAGAKKFAFWEAQHGYLMTLNDTGNVGIGTTNPQYKLAVNGNIGAQDIIVTNTGWSDYVFRPGYRLRPLSEVDQYIQTNGHLPDIPAEAEVKKKGVSLGDMQAKLLAKVEELTLHMIQQDKENRELRDRLARLEKGAAADPSPAVPK